MRYDDLLAHLHHSITVVKTEHTVILHCNSCTSDLLELAPVPESVVQAIHSFPKSATQGGKVKDKKHDRYHP